MKHIKTYERLIQDSDPRVVDNELGDIILQIKGIIENIKEEDNIEKTKIILNHKYINEFEIKYNTFSFDIALIRVEFVIYDNGFWIIVSSNTSSKTNSVYFLELLKNKFKNNIAQFIESNFSQYLKLEFNKNEIDNVLKEITLEEYYLYLDSKKYNL